MAPSRGLPHPSTPPAPATPSSATPRHSAIDTKGDQALEKASSNSLATARRNFTYLVSPSNSNAPARLRTRALLRSVRYIAQFIIWRVVRWAKYAAIAAITATALGSVVSGVAWIAAPTGIGASIIAASIWGVGKFAARRLQARMHASGDKGGKKEGDEDGLEADIREEREKREMQRKLEREGAGLRGMPW